LLDRAGFIPPTHPPLWLQGSEKLMAILQRVGELQLVSEGEAAAAAQDPLLGAAQVPPLLRQWAAPPGARGLLARLFLQGWLAPGARPASAVGGEASRR
jgi:hypothetical protein